MWLACTLIILLALCSFAQDKPPATPESFGGTYEQLRAPQKKLIDEWYAEYNTMMHEHDDPADYSQLSLSTRTTFEAVTHALLTTKLTDKSGRSLGNALDLVQSIETINGKVPQARGDLQFRMYVVLKPEALQTLKDSTEFFRDRDNTVYHHGYPLNYRQDGGVPSIQISMARNGGHADIDVDYRSSRVPAALFNGHLSAANSDVREGNNTQRHVQRWEGLTDWWHNLFGLEPSDNQTAESVAAAGEVPAIPRKAADKLEDAVQDFLTSWLEEQKPELAAAYLSPRSFACLEEYGPQSGTEINAGIGAYLAARDMAATNRLLGKPSNLQNVVKSSPVDDPRLKLVRQPYESLFALYQVPDGVASEFECNPESAFQDFEGSRVSGTKGKYGRYFGSVFRLKPPHGKGDSITMLWAKDGKYWKIISWDVEPEDAKPDAVPDTRRPGSASAKPEVRTKGDAAFLHQSDQFLRSWLVAKDYAAALSYLSPQCDPCISLYLDPGEKEPKTQEQDAEYLRETLSRVGEEIGPVVKLKDAIEPTKPDHEDLKLVSHSAENAYTLVAVPDYLAESFRCRKPSPQQPYQAPSENSLAKVYGNYYGMLFEVRTPGEHAATLALLWSRENSQWKIISYRLLTP